MRRVLVTGASGLLGRAVCRRLEEEAGWQVLGLAFSRAQGRLRKVDITDPDQLAAVFDEFKPEAVVHAAAERRPDVVEGQEDATRALNVSATGTLCQLAAKHGAVVVYISTDYVFDGTKPPYKETDTPNPLNKYGASKLEGEKVTMETSSENLVLRVPILYGPVEFVEESAVTVLFKALSAAAAPAAAGGSAGPCVMSHYERRFPTHVADVAAALQTLLEARAQDPSLCGYFHWTSEDDMTKYDMALAMAELFGLPASLIEADARPSSGAPRPHDAHLDSSRLRALGVAAYTPFKEGLESCLRPFFKPQA